MFMPSTALMAAKEMEFRDAPKGRDLTEDRKATNRQLELEIKDLNGYLNAQLAGAGLSGSRTARLLYGSSQEQYKPKPHDKGPER
jgi:hypothetical protein